jgi:hypothetical protein
MRSWTLVLCEGVHDQKAITALLLVCGGWKKPDKIPSKLPVPLRATYLLPAPRRKGNQPTPDYLLKSDRYIVIRAMESKDNVFGQSAIDYLRQHEPDAVGAVIDANDAGVADGVASYRTTFGQLYDHASDVKAGSVVQGSPTLGLWVAPDNRSAGRLDDALLQAAQKAKPKLAAAGERFVKYAEKNEPGSWTDDRTKALLGAVYQVVNPGASLAVSLRDSACWFDQGLSKTEPFKALLEFLGKLTLT